MSELTFQVLAADTENKVRSKDGNSLIRLISADPACGTEEKDPRIEEAEGVIKLSCPNHSVRVFYESADATQDGFARVKIWCASSDEPHIANLRGELLAFLDKEGFAYKSVLKDDVSKAYAKRLYEALYEVESRMRGYLQNIFVKNIGVHWPEQVYRDEAEKKQVVKRNLGTASMPEWSFSNLKEELFMYGYEFSELGNLITESANTKKSRADLIEQIKKMSTESSNFMESFTTLQEDLQTNYQKFFEKHFPGFKNRWQELTKTRNSVAHCRIFDTVDLENGLEYSADILAMLDNAEKEISEDDVVFDTNEISPPPKQEVNPPSRDLQSKGDCKADVLERLEKELILVKGSKRFVGRRFFMNDTCVRDANMNYYDVQEALEALVRDGVVEIYHVDNPHSEYQTSALRII